MPSRVQGQLEPEGLHWVFIIGGYNNGATHESTVS